MAFELLPTITPWLIGFAVVGLASVTLAVVGITDFFVSNHKTRVSRHESIRTYLRPAHAQPLIPTSQGGRIHR